MDCNCQYRLSDGFGTRVRVGVRARIGVRIRVRFRSTMKATVWVSINWHH